LRLYIGFARQDEAFSETRGDGKHYLALRPGELAVAVRARNTGGLRSAYDKIRIRRLADMFLMMSAQPFG
jgi:hypothetical protein